MQKLAITSPSVWQLLPFKPCPVFNERLWKKVVTCFFEKSESIRKVRLECVRSGISSSSILFTLCCDSKTSSLVVGRRGAGNDGEGGELQGICATWRHGSTTVCVHRSLSRQQTMYHSVGVDAVLRYHCVKEHWALTRPNNTHTITSLASIVRFRRALRAKKNSIDSASKHDMISRAR